MRGSEESHASPLADLPLHTITETYGTAGLMERFHLEMSDLDELGQELVNHAFHLANELHRDDSRSGGEPYINHLLRVCIRIKHHYEVDDPDVLAASLLHDVVEDHGKTLTETSGGQEPNEFIAEMFNPRVSSLVEAVTNPDFDKNQDMVSQYVDHLIKMVNDPDPLPIIIKLSDFTDNATGINYGTGIKMKKWAYKYHASLPVMRMGLDREDLPLSPHVKQHIAEQLDVTQSRVVNVLNSKISPSV